MSEQEHKPESRDLPRPRIRKMRWPFPWIWLAPICALAVAAGYLHLHYQEQGARITIQFNDVEGVVIGQTPLTMRGVAIGKVADLELSDDHKHVLVHVALQRKYASIAGEGALFWIVRPDFSNGNITGLGTVVSGPYIQAVPGVGERRSEFVGLDKQPVSLGNGLILILHASRLEHLGADSPVFYRGIQVGIVQSAHFATNASHIDINVVIRERFAKLVTPRSEFWKISGADVEGGIFSGISVKLDSLRTLLSGGIEFATPDDGPTEPAKDGAQFTLHDEPKKDWLAWTPKINLPPDAISEPEAESSATDTGRIGSAIKEKQEGH
jgi:paraquat-inducible protein B